MGKKKQRFSEATSYWLNEVKLQREIAKQTDDQTVLLAVAERIEQASKWLLAIQYVRDHDWPLREAMSYALIEHEMPHRTH